MKWKQNKNKKARKPCWKSLCPTVCDFWLFPIIDEPWYRNKTISKKRGRQIWEIERENKIIENSAICKFTVTLQTIKLDNNFYFIYITWNADFEPKIIGTAFVSCW